MNQMKNLFMGWKNFVRNTIASCADEVQSGFEDQELFLLFKKFKINPDIITMAKGMGNGFPIVDFS